MVLVLALVAIFVSYCCAATLPGNGVIVNVNANESTVITPRGVCCIHFGIFSNKIQHINEYLEQTDYSDIKLSTFINDLKFLHTECDKLQIEGINYEPDTVGIGPLLVNVNID